MLPTDWDLRFIDLNVETLSRKDIEAADLVLTSAMIVQRASFEKIVALCKESGKPLVAGGPYPTSCHEQIEGVDHFVLGEAEVNLPPFLADFKNGNPKSCYRDITRPDITHTPPPRRYFDRFHPDFKNSAIRAFEEFRRAAERLLAPSGEEVGDSVGNY